MLSGIADWNFRSSMKSMNFCMPFGFSAPFSTPAYSTWRKQVSSSARVGGAVSPSAMVNGGEEEYDVTIGRAPFHHRR